MRARVVSILLRPSSDAPRFVSLPQLRARPVCRAIESLARVLCALLFMMVSPTQRCDFVAVLRHVANCNLFQ
jgi:hypothetical protein